MVGKLYGLQARATAELLCGLTMSSSDHRQYNGQQQHEAPRHVAGRGELGQRLNQKSKVLQLTRHELDDFESPRCLQHLWSKIIPVRPTIVPTGSVTACLRLAARVVNALLAA